MITTRLRLFAFSMIAVLLFCLLAVVVAEMVLRSTGNVPSFRNSWGFHDAEPNPGSDESIKILLVGDSFVEGEAVDVKQIVGQRLQHYLSEKKPVEVISLGTPGAGQAQELLLLEQYLPIVKPTYVVLAFLPANDVMNNSQKLEIKKDKPFFDLIDGQLTAIPGEKPTPKSKSRLFICNELRRRWDSSRQLRAKIEAGGGIPLDFRVFEESADPKWQKAWQITFALMKKMEDTVTQNQAKLIVAVINDRNQLDPQAFARLQKEYPAMSNIKWNPQAPTQKMLTWCRENSVPAVDLFSSLAGNNWQDLFLEDGHWSVAGHDRAGREIAASLEKVIEPPLP